MRCLACLVLAASAATQPQLQDLGRTHVPPPRFLYGSPALADLDGDQDLDVLMTGLPPQVLRNDGHAVFADVTLNVLPTRAFSADGAAAGDVDGDGDLDVLLVSRSQSDLLLRNNGQGVLTLAPFPWSTYGSSATVLADFDRDGDLDAALHAVTKGGTTPPAHRLCLNDGLGTFTEVTGTRMPALTTSTTALAAVDVDGDGDQDLVLDGLLYANDGRASFTDVTPGRLPPSLWGSIAAGDADGDGDLDLVIGDKLLLNDGRGTFADGTAGRLPLGARPEAFGDVDGDGDLDLAAAPSSLWTNDGSGRFADVSAAQMPSHCVKGSGAAFGDVDGDRDLDLVLGWNQLYLNDGRGTFTSATEPRCIPTSAGYVTGLWAFDADGDGDLDLLLGQGQDRLLLNDGDGRLLDSTAGRLPPTMANTAALAAGDVDADGDLDLVTDSGRLLESYGQARFRDVTTGRLNMGIRATQVALADLDSDGDQDLLVGASGQDELHRNDGSGRFLLDPSALPADGNTPTSLALVDLDGDQDLDAVLATGSAAGTLLLNDGSGRFADASTRLPAASDVRLRPGDLDGDGDQDLAGTDRSRLHLYANDGTARFTDISAGRLPTLPRAAIGDLALGDVDGDGDLDVLPALHWAKALLLNDGSARFADVGISRLPNATSQRDHALLLDLDGDQDLEAAMVDPTYGPVLWFNGLRQVHTPWLARVGRPWQIELQAQRGFASPGQVALPLLAAGRVLPGVKIPGIGCWQLDPCTTVPLAPIAIPTLYGQASLTVTLPVTPALVGQRFHVQALLARANALSATNALTETVLP